MVPAKPWGGNWRFDIINTPTIVDSETAGVWKPDCIQIIGQSLEHGSLHAHFTHTVPKSHFNRILSAGAFLEANSNSPLLQNRYPYRCPTHELSSEKPHWHDNMTYSWAKTEQWALSSLGDSERTAAEIQRCHKTRSLVRADPGSWCSKMFPITSAPLRRCTSKQRHGEVSPAYTSCT